MNHFNSIIIGVFSRQIKKILQTQQVITAKICLKVYYYRSKITHIHMGTYTYTHTLTHMDTHTHTYTWVHLYSHTHTHTHIYIYIYIYIDFNETLSEKGKW